MQDSVFKCANIKCNQSVASKDLNKVQLQVLRRWLKLCPACKQSTKWQETRLILDDSTNLKIGFIDDQESTNQIKNQKRRQKRNRNVPSH